MKRLSILFMAVGILVSCTIKSKDQSTPASTSIAVLSPTPPATVSISLSSTLTLTPKPTQTLTLQPVRATVEAVIGSCAGEKSSDYIRYPYAYSNNDQWTAVVCQDNGIYTKVFRIDGTRLWNALALDIDATISGPEWFLYPYLWAKDGRYLYLAPRILGSIDCLNCFPVNGFGLYRLNLSNGNLETGSNQISLAITLHSHRTKIILSLPIQITLRLLEFVNCPPEKNKH